MGNIVRSIADQLSGGYRTHQHGEVILPFTILRALGCNLEPTRDHDALLAEAEKFIALAEERQPALAAVAAIDEIELRGAAA